MPGSIRLPIYLFTGLAFAAFGLATLRKGFRLREKKGISAGWTALLAGLLLGGYSLVQLVSAPVP